MRWHADPLGDFYNCNETTVVYFDHASGDTHLLGEFAAYLLQTLAVQPMDAPQLIARLSPGVDPTDRAELERTVPQVLDELLALDVIARLDVDA
jgi:PqqD family protein of HPr-rel-A system